MEDLLAALWVVLAMATGLLWSAVWIMMHIYVYDDLTVWMLVLFWIALLFHAVVADRFILPLCFTGMIVFYVFNEVDWPVAWSDVEWSTNTVRSFSIVAGMAGLVALLVVTRRVLARIV